MNAKLGRPKQAVTRDILIGARFTSEEAQSIEAAVEQANRVKSDWVREILLMAARGPGQDRPLSPTPSAPSIMYDQSDEAFLD